MNNASTRIYAGTVIVALLGAVMLGAATAQTSPPDYATEWKNVKEEMADGDVDGAQSIYQSVFASGASAAPETKTAIESAFGQAHDASGTSDLKYVAANQAIDKALYAVAYHNVLAAAENGDSEKAKAWFGLLEAKFSGDADLPDAKAAFADVTDATVADAASVLPPEYIDVITAKVYTESFETPGILQGGDQPTAVKEAAEGRYYYLSILSDVGSRMGTSFQSNLTGTLDALLDAALAGDQATVDAEADSVLDLTARYALATADLAKGQAWADVKASAKAKDLAAAQATYDDEFAAVAQSYAEAAHARVQTAFDDAQAALDAGDDAVFAVQTQIIEKSVYDIAFRVAFHELAEGEIAEGVEYYGVLLEKFGWVDEPGEGPLAIGHIDAFNKVTDEQLATARQGTVDKFLTKVREEVDEVFIHWDENPATAREKAIEGVLYYHPARDAVALTLGDAPADELLSELEELYNATTARDKTAAEGASVEILKLLDLYAAEGAEVTEIDSLVNNLRGKLEFVIEEYDGYYQAKEIGDETEANVELGEAKAFLAGARSLIEQNEDTLRSIDSGSVDQIYAHLDDAKEVLGSLEPLAELETPINAAVDLLVALQESQIEGTITVRIGQAAPGSQVGTLVVPIHLEGLPDGGFGFQFEVAYDTTKLEATSVQVFLDVQASTIDDDTGKVRFNGAATETIQSSLKVAEVTFRVTGASADMTNVELTVEELANAQGDALGVKEVEGGSVALSAASDSELRSVPAPGMLAAFAALLAALVWLGTRRRER